jgi:hypothetical protein
MPIFFFCHRTYCLSVSVKHFSDNCQLSFYVLVSVKLRSCISRYTTAFDSRTVGNLGISPSYKLFYRLCFLTNFAPFLLYYLSDISNCFSFSLLFYILCFLPRIHALSVRTLWMSQSGFKKTGCFIDVCKTGMIKHLTAAIKGWSLCFGWCDTDLWPLICKHEQSLIGVAANDRDSSRVSLEYKPFGYLFSTKLRSTILYLIFHFKWAVTQYVKYSIFWRHILFCFTFSLKKKIACN